MGVNIIARNEMMVMPMMRRLGPAAVPGIRPLRNDIATATASATQQCQHREAARHRTVGRGHEQPLVADVLLEPAQAGPDRGLERAGLDLAGEGLVAEDQDRGDADRRGDRRQQRQQRRTARERRCRMVRSGPIATSSAPIDAIPVGPENSVSAPMMQAIASGSSRLVATARSTEHQVEQDAQRDDRLGPQAVVQRQPERQEHARRGPGRRRVLCLTAWPRRGITSRLITHQQASAISRVGSRIQTLVVETCAHSASRS